MVSEKELFNILSSEYNQELNHTLSTVYMFVHGIDELFNILLNELPLFSYLSFDRYINKYRSIHSKFVKCNNNITYSIMKYYDDNDAIDTILSMSETLIKFLDDMINLINEICRYIDIILFRKTYLPRNDFMKEYLEEIFKSFKRIVNDYSSCKCTIPYDKRSVEFYISLMNC